MAIANYITWKAKAWVFSAYNKEFGQKVEYKPEQFILLSEDFCISGFDIKTNTPIYSNLIKDISKEEIIAKTKLWEVFNWLYDKEKIESLGGKITRRITVYENGDINTYDFTGKCIGSWSDSRKKLLPATGFVKFDGSVKDGLNYRPVFINGDNITDKDLEEARTAWENHKKDVSEKKDSNNSGGALPF